MFNQIIKENVQGQKHSLRCVGAESELPSFRKHECEGQEWMKRTYNPYNSRNAHDEMALYSGISKRNAQWHSALKLRTSQASPVDCDEVQLINA